ncbi:MAG: 4-hydroxybenzoate octaprenyltransferase, partial [Gammaproteobacteria bacterium]
ELIRLHRPIGIFLLLWPIWWSLWLATAGLPSLKLLIIFTAGVFLMRSAGCIINDLIDQPFDGNVQRTQYRPLITHAITQTQALVFFILLCLIALALVLQLNLITVLLACLALVLSVLYPFMKRIIYLPQLVLGVAWYIGILMAFTAVNGHLNATAWLVYITGIIWTIIYDTMYAMVDRNDDILIGIKSTAILFGRFDTSILALLQLSMILLLCLIGDINHLSWPYYIGIIVASSFFLYQQYLIKNRQPANCLAAFSNNHWVGMSIFLGIFFSLI